MGQSRHLARDIVVIGGSAGALGPLRQIVSALPADLPAAIVVVLHLGPSARSGLADLLDRIGALQAETPHNGDPLRPGFIYVAQPDHHLVVTSEGLLNTRTAPVHRARPSVDVLFYSAANVYGRRATGIVLSGSLDDGADGLAAIRSAGGRTIVQDPEEAKVKSMPRHAIAIADPDHVLASAAIAEVVASAPLVDRALAAPDVAFG